jgi:NADH:ubiquinone oxidoreductase subunit F (NADH-binding)/NADH:ubiquinone oxidoreductase subunit E
MMKVNGTVPVVEGQPVLSDEEKLSLRNIVEADRTNHAGRQSYMDILFEVQKRYGNHIPQAVLGEVAHLVGTPPAQIDGFVSFYTMLSTRPRGKHVIRVCTSGPCHIAGAPAVVGELKKLLGIDLGETTSDGMFTLEASSCLGLCGASPALMIDDYAYGNLATGDLVRILDAKRSGWPLDSSSTKTTVKDTIKGEQRIVLRNAGLIDPENIDEYIARDGYAALKKALSMTPAEVVQIVVDSKLQGRGGAGFPTGMKWSFVAREQSDEKYVICNADEGEPGTFKDRLILEGDPHSIVESMAIAGYAVGARIGIVYIRGEYALSIARVKKAISDARAQGLLGENILGKGFSFDIEVYSGGGAYVCGEEFALLESIENKRGTPRSKPPFPPEKGLFGKPTLINNVETLANIPPILQKGSEWFKSIGTPSSAGTKVFSLSGDLVNRGAVEAPFGVTLRQIIEDFGGGVRDGKRIGFIQTGGSAGTVLSSKYLDIPLDFASMKAYNVSIGSGVVLVASEDVPLLPFLDEVAHFFHHESCGKCTPCREGTLQVKAIIDSLVNRTADPQALSRLHKLLDLLVDTSFCGLGQAAPLAFDSALRNFPEVFEQALGESHAPEACGEE